MDLFGEWRNKMKLKDKIAEFEIKLAELKAECSRQEVEYPLFRRSREAGIIVKFTSLSEGTVVWKGDSGDYIGHTTGRWIKHTNTWEEVAYDKDRDLWDGQPVWSWNDVHTHLRDFRFYDAVNRGVYNYDGTRGGIAHDNIKAVNPDHYESWMIEAYVTLER